MKLRVGDKVIRKQIPKFYEDENGFTEGFK